jgi:hypothetical protein
MITYDDYMSFFEKWLHHQFPRVENDWENFYILKIVSLIVKDPDELSHWATRDCWSMYDFAKSNQKESNHV